MSMNDKEILDALNAHYELQLGTYLAAERDLNGARYTLGEEVVSYYWNYAGAVRASESKASALIDRAVAFAKEKGRQPAFYLDPGTQPLTFRDTLKEKGFSKVDAEDWMFHGTSGGVKLADTSHLSQIRTVTTVDQLKAFIRIFDICFSSTMESDGVSQYGHALLRSFSQAPSGVRTLHLLGFFNGEPVSIGSLHSKGKWGGVYNIGTLPDYRHKGYGSAVVSQLMDAAQKSGLSQTVLQTEHDGEAQQIFKRAGFQIGFAAEIWVLET